jgi:hypothetical protein
LIFSVTDRENMLRIVGGRAKVVRLISGAISSSNSTSSPATVPIHDCAAKKISGVRNFSVNSRRPPFRRLRSRNK